MSSLPDTVCVVHCIAAQFTKWIVHTESSGLDSSLKRHQALIKRMRQSMAAENHSQILKDIETLSLEKYVDEIAGAAAEGIGRCKTEKDIWSAVEVSVFAIA